MPKEKEEKVEKKKRSPTVKVAIPSKGHKDI